MKPGRLPPACNCHGDSNLSNLRVLYVCLLGRKIFTRLKLYIVISFTLAFQQFRPPVMKLLHEIINLILQWFLNGISVHYF